MQFRTVLPSASSASACALMPSNMPHRVRPIATPWALTALLSLLGAAGCDDLGKCDETKARTIVINGEGQALYAGQAILNVSCAAGQCHASGAKGAQRQGVPKDLDFDLQPAALESATSEDGVPSGKVQVNSKSLSKLRRNQRLVFDKRDSIWAQIEDGLMPPDGVGADFLKAAPGFDVTVEGTACKRGTEALDPISAKSTKTIVRNWLACGAPVVELSAASIPTSVLSATPAGLQGTVGQQMPFCQDCEAPITFDQLYANVLTQSCVAGCHTSDGIAPPGDYDGFDLSNLEVAYESLTGASKLGGSNDCNTPEAPLVVPGDPAASYLVAKMGGSAASPLTVCGATMPFGQSPLECGVQQVITWIKEGAPKPGEAVEGTGDDGDAGVSKPDAGM